MVLSSSRDEDEGGGGTYTEDGVVVIARVVDGLATRRAAGVVFVVGFGAGGEGVVEGRTSTTEGALEVCWSSSIAGST